ncbi:NAD(P)H-binding protein [Sphaerisporangium sp. TRM90804]|uniref:NAD(P)-dependent oxidoreductase n=1 Tax=Sphaerisporangium sp. TRM90804 TaxID=3031113 RepID=UPI002449207A|nr:NAD(P)H-binding protein [Sphaerisporangium sp. TRM90804]MDH2429950.1 NAD(P)H-binding protein [Sphaerisporangium sp. TRM90804]
MKRIIVFGAGGRAGRATVREAVLRGHEVTAVVRDPARHATLASAADEAPIPAADGRVAVGGGRSAVADGRAGTGDAGITAADGRVAVGRVRVVAGDVTDAGGVARLAAGHDAAVNAACDLGVPPDVYFTGAARALVDGLTAAGVRRLVAVGLASVLETPSGTPLMDTPGYPQEYRAFYLGHAAGTDVLRAAAPPALDWLVLSPAGDFDHGGARTGGYRPAAAEAASRVSYPDFAIALLDEIEAPRHNRVHLGVEQGL